MAEPDLVMNGPVWPPEWQTGWVTFRYSDIKGNPVEGNVTITNSVPRAVGQVSKTTVYGGSVVVPLAFGVPSGPDAQENADGIMCIEFPIGTDPDVIPAEMQLVAVESFSRATIRKVLTAEHTLDNPLWLSGDLDAVAAQPGVIKATIWEVANENLGIPTEAAVGDYIFYVIPGKFTKKTGA
jgi:hypothetical protein